MTNIPDASSLDNSLLIKNKLIESINTIKSNIATDIKNQSKSGKNFITLNLSDFMPSPAELGIDYQYFTMEVTEAILKILVDKHYEPEIDIINGNILLNLKWKNNSYKLDPNKVYPLLNKYIKKNN